MRVGWAGIDLQIRGASDRRAVVEPVLLGAWLFSPAIPILGVYVILLVAATYEMVLAGRRGTLLDPYYSNHRSATKLLHETLPNLGVPVYLMVLATLSQPINGSLLFVFLFWRLVLGRADLLWPLRVMPSWLKR